MLDLPSGLDERFQSLGFAVIEYALTRADLVRMDALFPSIEPGSAGARFDGFSGEARRWLNAHEGLARLAGRLIGVGSGDGLPYISRFQAFDKSEGANWFVPWHQDRAEDGRERPVAELERTVALRIHLDDCDEDNGPLEVVPGSHTSGRLDGRAIVGLVAERQPLLCLDRSRGYCGFASAGGSSVATGAGGAGAARTSPGISSRWLTNPSGSWARLPVCVAQMTCYLGR